MHPQVQLSIWVQIMMTQKMKEKTEEEALKKKILQVLHLMVPN